MEKINIFSSSSPTDKKTSLAAAVKAQKEY